MYYHRRFVCKSLVWLVILLAPLEALAALPDYCNGQRPSRCRCPAEAQAEWQSCCHGFVASEYFQEDSSPADLVVPQTYRNPVNSADKSTSAIMFGKTQQRLSSKQAMDSAPASQRCVILCRLLR
jgi:hypothetical protein